MLTSPIAGTQLTGQTSPTYTIVADVPPNSNSKQFAVTATGGTQIAGTDTGSTPSRPWTFTFTRPASIKQLNAVDGNNVLRSVPMNVYVSNVRKGLTPLAGQPAKVASVRTEFTIPAGADTADIPNLKAMLSVWSGGHVQAINNIAAMLTTGVMA